MRRRNWILVAFMLFALPYLGIAYFFSNQILYPPQKGEKIAKENLNNLLGKSPDDILREMTAPQNITIASEEDGIPINVKYFQQSTGSDCAVVFSHGWSGNWLGGVKYAPIFWDCGCDVLLYDHRAHNKSGGVYATAGVKEKVDLISVTNWLQKQTGLPNEKIGWMGESWGAATVLQAGALDKDMAFIIAESPFQDWYSAIFERAIESYGPWVQVFTPAIFGIVNYRTGIDYRNASPLNQAADIVEPVLLLHSKTDKATASRQSVNIAARLNPAKSIFHHLDWGAPHAQNSIAKPKEYKALVIEFIEKKVGKFGNCP